MLHLLRPLMNGNQKRSVFSVVSIMILFWSLFDALLSFAIPVQLTTFGFSKTMTGIIIGSSSLAGAVFDFLLCRLLRNASYRRLYLLLFLTCFATGFFLWKATNVWFFLIVMALWGLYYDVMNFGNFNFIARQKISQHAGYFGVLEVFKAVGYLIGPIIAGLYIHESVESYYFILMFVFLSFGFIAYLTLSFLTRASKEVFPHRKHSLSIVLELKQWKHLGRILLPVLLFMMLLNIYDAFFWTIGPLVSEQLVTIQPFGGLFLAAYFLPILLLGWFTGHITHQFGKKRTAFASFGIGCLILSTLGFTTNQVFIIAIVFFASCFATLAWPAIRAAFTDYMSELPTASAEIEGLADFFTNIGYIVGPILAGICADFLGLLPSFMAVGITGAVVSLLLFTLTPKHIHMPSVTGEK